MAKLSAFVKISGNLLENVATLAWLRELAKIYFLVVCIGGGEQIGEEFCLRGWDDKCFGPMGRITKSPKQRQLARDILEDNQAVVQDVLSEVGISAIVVIPVIDIGSVLCHINGDLYLLAAYNGYDRLFLLTTESRVEKKQQWLRQITETFQAVGKGELDKIEVVGF